MRRLTISLLATFICFFALFGTSYSSGFPSRDIQVVVPFSAGGGSSITGQIAAQIIQEERYLPVNLNVINKPGGGMAVGMSYLKTKKGDPHYIMLFTPLILTTPLQGDVKVNINDFTPIVVFGYQLAVLCSKADDDRFKTLQDVVQHAKANPGKISIAVAGIGGGQHTFASLLAEATGCEFNVVPFSGSAKGTAALLGGHVDLSVVHLNEIGDFIEAKKVNALGIASKKRVANQPDIPTFIEQGYNFTYGMPRGIVAPGNIPEDARQVLGSTFKKLCESERWKKEFIDKFVFLADPMYLDDAKSYLEEQEIIYKDFLKKTGLIK